MGELIVALLTVIAALLVHLVVWKVRVPRRQTRAILTIFFALLAAVLAALPAIAAHVGWLGLPQSPPPSSYVHIVICVAAAALSYMMTYTVIEVDSPSLVMALVVARAGDAGLPEAEFLRLMDDSLLVEPRIRDMLRDGLVSRDGDGYALTPKGRAMARLFIAHRSLLKAGKGG